MGVDGDPNSGSAFYPRVAWNSINNEYLPDGDLDADDRVDEAIAESFPASDPPSWTAGLDDD